ncbi:TonB family C-terminal domain-containing protein [Hymenobacter arizonensis]|uniref:TonB family C-terminal domain-containing protein n=2 Tax=Hymenobacter arizonensis TaxID=1227077 RepID=A0A1I5XDC4_HYMAR|nr:TonB family C-terminal domain-containing protein [Hymenobacter arizonensis]
MLFYGASSAIGQKSKSPPIAESPSLGNSYNMCWGAPEQMPELAGGGGIAAIINAVQNHIIYPEQALAQDIQGRVFVTFTVATDGLVQDVTVIKGIGGGCDEATLAAVQQLPRFTPAKQTGKAVPVALTLPVTFQIPTSPKKK